LLGLHPSADFWAIKRTYRRLIRQLHPNAISPNSPCALVEGRATLIGPCEIISNSGTYDDWEI